MQRVRSRLLALAVIALFATTFSLAESVTYLDQNYHPASERSYAFKRVIKYKNPIAITHIGRDETYGDWYSHSELTGLHLCSLTDYFPGGEVALVANVITNVMTCEHWNFDGKVVYYYRSGHIRKTEFYSVGKLQGDVITYAEDGRILSKAHYERGQAIDNAKYAVAPNHPLVGKWKYVKLNTWNAPSLCKGKNVPDYCTEYTLEWTISSNGTSDLQIRRTVGSGEVHANWKYASTGPNTGVIEEFQGENSIGRCDVHWFSRNEFDCTITFSPDANMVGEQRHYVRE